MMANAAYKHEVGHAGKKFACKCCNKAFQFKGALKDHLKMHTETLAPIVILSLQAIGPCFSMQ